MAWRRGQASGQDLRERVLGAAGLSLRAAAARFAVSPSYVSKVRARLRETGDTAPGPQRNHVCAAPAGAARGRAAGAGGGRGRRDPGGVARLGAGRARGPGQPAGDVEDAGPLGPDAQKNGCARPSRTAPTSPKRGVPGRTEDNAPRFDPARLVFLDETWATTARPDPPA